MKEFFGFGDYARQPEGFLSWQHLLFVGSLLLVYIALYYGLFYLFTEKRKRRTR